MPHLKTLADCTSLPPAQIRKAFGGKALGLFEAHQLGIPVPLTWFLSSDHFEKLLAQNPTLDPRDFQNLARDSIYTLLEEEMKKLPEGKFAIRSSGWHEDSNIQSYAGIFETKLNIAKQDIPDAIASVWESSFSLRALSYQTPDEMLTMGIIIQPMVTAKFSGVLFSRHPSPSNVFENRDIVIEFAHASGEKVAGGQVIPLRLTGSFETLSTLTDFPWINPLLKATLHLTTAYQHDVDIEFTIDQNEQFWLLQQRPISKTTQSHTLDLSAYQRAYKRSLCTLDIELLIEGCSKHLASYL